MVYLPSTSVDVAALRVPATCTTTETPGSGSRPAVMCPSTRHVVTAGAGAAAGCCESGEPADALTTQAVTRASPYQSRTDLISDGNIRSDGYTPRLGDAFSRAPASHRCCISPH